jgi:hypothetical protein
MASLRNSSNGTTIWSWARSSWKCEKDEITDRHY